MSKASLTLIIAISISTGCNTKVAQEPPPARGSAFPSDPEIPFASSPLPAPPASGLKDSQTISILIAFAKAEIEVGKQALGKTKTPRIQNFAQRMVSAQTNIYREAVALMAKMGVAAHPTEASDRLASSGQNTTARLAALPSAEFDNAYIVNEAQNIKAMVGIVVNELLPSATNEELQTLLKKLEPLLQEDVKYIEQMRLAD